MMNDYESDDARTKWVDAHKNYDHENPPKNSRIPSMIQYINGVFELSKLEWSSEKKTFINGTGSEYSTEMMFDMCSIMGLDPFEEVTRIILEETIEKLRDKS